MKKKQNGIRYNKCKAISNYRQEVDKISDEEQLSYWLDTYQNLIFSICYKMTGNYFDAEDLTQDTFLSAYRNIARFDGRNEKTVQTQVYRARAMLKKLYGKVQGREIRHG